MNQEVRDTRQTFNITHVRSMSPRESSFGSLYQLGTFHQGGSTTQMPTALEDIIKLKKELRLKQAEFEKEKALLQQKNDQMQSQLTETQERFVAQATMYESMINSLKAHDSSSTTQMLASKLQASERQAYEDEISELKDFRRKLQEDMGNRDHEYHKAMSDKESQMKEIQLQVERLLLDKSQQLFGWEIERKELQQKYQMSISEKDQAETMAEMRYQNKVTELQSEMDKVRLAHMIETEKIKSDYENSLKDLKLLHEQEKQNLEYRLDRQSHDLRSLHHMVVQQDQTTGDTAESTKQHREQLSAEIGTIQAEVDKIKSQFDGTVQQLTKEKELAEARNEKLQKQLEKLKNAPKQPASVRIDLPFRPSELVQGPDGESVMGLQRQVKNLKEEVSLLQGENEKLNDQVKKMRKEATDMQEYADKLEQNEKKLRQVLNDQSLIEQDQLVELRRQLNMEKKRVLEHSEIMSQMKDNLERENHRQQTTIIEKEQEIRTLNADLRNHEKKLYDIQSMFNTQMVGNSMNMSGMMGGFAGENMHQRGASQQYPILGGLNMPGMASVAYSQNNFSPQKFMGQGVLGSHSINMQPSFAGQMNPMMMDNLGQQQFQQNFNDPHNMMLRSIQRMGDALPQGQVECPHCYLLLDSNDYLIHLQHNHGITNNVSSSFQGGIPRSHSQSQLHTMNTFGMAGGNQYLSRQQAAQSVCIASSKSQANLPLYKKGFAEDRHQEVNLINQAQSNQPVMYLSQQPPINMGMPNYHQQQQPYQQITRIPSFTQNTNNPVVQQSPRTMVGQRFGPNNRSFTCLLKEIDEEEEKNIVGSIPGGSRLNRDFGQTKQMAELMETSEDGPLPRHSGLESTARADDRKSRNLHQGSNLLKPTQDGAGSTVNYGMTTGQTNTSIIKQELRPSTSSELNQSNTHVRAYNHDPLVTTSRESLKSTRKSHEKSQTAQTNNISNEIKDLLDKLVTYQGGSGNQQVDTKFSQHSNNSENQSQYGELKHSLGGGSNNSNQDEHFCSRQHNLISTESLVELRSSDESLFVLGGNGKTYDFRPHATARDMFKMEILKPSIGSSTEGPSGLPVSSSVNNPYGNRKSQPAKQQKPPQNGQQAAKSKSKNRPNQAAKEACNQGPKKVMMINTGISTGSSHPKISSLDQPCLSRESSSPPHNGGRISGDSSDEKPPSVDRETARHTSKDTIMTNNMQQRHKKGRRYHEVNQSNILTPNSPRRYQEYFKNKTVDTSGYTGSLKSIPQNTCENKTSGGGLTSAVKGLGQNKAKAGPPGMNTNVHQYQQNHRYSPSNSQSVVNDSQYHQISPEKPKMNKNTFVLDKGLPLQNQLQNVMELQKNTHPKQFYGNYDSGTVLCGGGPNSDYGQPYKMMNGLGFTPGGANFIITGPKQNAFFDNSMDDDGEIRPSQIDEFTEKQENKANSAMMGITSSYISIGDDDPFITGKFQDASTKQINFKANSNEFKHKY